MFNITSKLSTNSTNYATWNFTESDITGNSFLIHLQCKNNRKIAFRLFTWLHLLKRMVCQYSIKRWRLDMRKRHILSQYFVSKSSGRSHRHNNLWAAWRHVSLMELSCYGRIMKYIFLIFFLISRIILISWIFLAFPWAVTIIRWGRRPVFYTSLMLILSTFCLQSAKSNSYKILDAFPI